MALSLVEWMDNGLVIQDEHGAEYVALGFDPYTKETPESEPGRFLVSSRDTIKKISWLPLSRCRGGAAARQKSVVETLEYLVNHPTWKQVVEAFIKSLSRPPSSSSSGLPPIIFGGLNEGEEWKQGKRAEDEED